MKLSKLETFISWFCQILAALIMLQTLYFKFTGAEESVYIFSTLNMEPWGRYMTGSAELIASILLLIPALAWLGAGMAIGIMAGALVSHLTILGIEVKGDGGYLFILCLLVFISSAVVLIIHRKQIPFLTSFFQGRQWTSGN